MKRLIIVYIFLLISNTFAWSHGELGSITFPTSTTNQVAQNYFKQGILMLHSFEYEESRKLFNLAISHDPDFVMAYWGLAQTYNHPLWNEQDLTGARNALARLASNQSLRKKKTKTLRERMFLNAIEALYGKGDKIYRDKQYVLKMHDLYNRYPNDNEIAIFYALSLLGVSEGVRNESYYMQAAGIIEEVFAENPKHPGALHYAIHSFDDPIHAPLGLRAATTYAKIAPDASHALHMPSHIFFALGMWPNVIKSNKAAWEAGFKHIQQKNLKASAYTIHDLHALQWLSYAYLQIAKPKKALKSLNQLHEIALSTNSAMSRWYYLKARAAFLLEMPGYTLDIMKNDDLELSVQSETLFVEQFQAFKLQKPVSTLAIQELHQFLEANRHRINKNDHISFFTNVTETSVLATEILELELKGLLAWQQGNINQAKHWLTAAIKKESKMSFSYGPPFPAKSSFELYGELLLSKKKYLKANYWFYQSLKRNPQKHSSKIGFNESSRALKKRGLLPKQIPLSYSNKLMIKKTR
ncbi:MAG: hypothetical protein HYX60_08135 [Legionella longbeachae]|nr:hypothetical protein [Legionella longbeachae]